jgi:hypothetical protein
MQLAPIILFVYNRPWHTEQTLSALEKNKFSEDSILYIYADGAKANAIAEQLRKIEEVRTLINQNWKFKEVHTVERTENWGLANNIVDGVTKIVNEYGNIIVLEDDIMTSAGFLKYMNEALTLYESEEKVGGISGFQVKAKHELPETSFLSKTTSWGWATYKSTWRNVSFEAKNLYSTIMNKDLNRFNFGHEDYYSRMLKERVEGKNNSWAICFYASIFLEKKLFLYPSKSLCRNIGFGEEATHTTGELKKTHDWATSELAESVEVIPAVVKENRVLRKCWEYAISNKKKLPYIQFLKKAVLYLKKQF